MENSEIQSKDFAPSPPTEPSTQNSTGIANLTEEAQSKGAIVHEFLPDTKPEDKAIKAKKGAPPPLKGLGKDNEGEGLVSDQHPNAKPVTPTVTVSDAKGNEEEKDGDGDALRVPGGGVPAEKAGVIPEWYKVGWQAQLDGIGGELTNATPEDKASRSRLEDWVSEMYYGQWYHNSAIIIFSVLATHFVTRFGGGWGWVFIVLAICATYYDVSARRFRRNARDDLTRELSKQRLFKDNESANWMNHFLQRFWLIYEPVLSATVVASVDQVLSVSIPSFLDSMRMSKFTLGTKPPRIDFVRTFTETEEDVVVMDWKISFNPNDTLDLTERQAQRKVNPKVVLTISVGKGILVAGKDIIVEDIAFTGLMRIRLKLMTNFPHIKTVDLSFMEKPAVDFVLKPVGFDLSMIPGLSSFIDSQIHANLSPMMYDPNVFTLNLEQMLSGAPADAAIGVLQVGLYQARGLKGSKIGGGTPDPYISVSVGGRKELYRTKIKHSTVNPHWNETTFVLVQSLNDVLSLGIWDYNEHRKDTELGTANFTLKELEEDATQENLTAPVMMEGKERGEMRFEVNFYPVLKPKKLEDGSEEPIPDSTSGIVRLTVHQAKELDSSKSMVGGSLNPYAQFFLKSVKLHQSQTIKRTPDPIWETYNEFLVTDKSSAVVGVKVLDDKSLAKDPVLGFVNIKVADLLEANQKQQDWFPLSGARRGKVRMTATWNPVLMAGAISGAGQYSPPIGVMRLWMHKGIDLKNVEALTGGKSDPYVRVLHSGIVVARTLVINNNLNPEWEEIIYVAVHNPKETLVLDVMDYQQTSKDRSLGVTELAVAGFMKEGDDKKISPWESTGRQSFKNGLKSDGKKTVKGTLVFDAEFVPCAHLKDISFEAPPSNADKIKSDDAVSDTSSIIEPTTPGTGVSTGKDEMSQQMEADMKRVEADKIKRGPLVNGDAEVDHEDTPPLSPTSPDKEDEAVELSKEELLSSQSGILVFHISTGQLAKKGARLELLLDDGYWPTYSTEKARSSHITWDEIGEAFIRELDYSRVILKLNEADKDSVDDVYATFRTDLKSFLDQCLHQPTPFILVDEQGGHKSTVTITAKYIPVQIKLEPVESVNNMGMLRVDLLDGKNLPAMDRNGKSDPYCVFTMNDEKVFRSEVIKKTLNPTWKQNFECSVPSRVGADFRVDVYDWDALGEADKIGRAQINLADLEPFERASHALELINVKTQKPQGQIRISMVFRPEFISRTRAATSTFSAAGRVATGLGGAVGAAGKGTFNFGGKAIGGVGKGALSATSRLTHRRSSSGKNAVPEDDVPPVPPMPGTQVSAPLENSAPGQVPSADVATNLNGYEVSGDGDEGLLKITVVSGKHLGEKVEKPYVAIRHGKKEVGETKHANGPEADWNETFQMKTSKGECVLDVAVLEKHRFGKDIRLGDAQVDIWQHIQPNGVLQARAVCSLGGEGEGGGLIELILDWSPSTAGMSLDAGRRSFVRDRRESVAASPAGSTKGGSRFRLGKNSNGPAQ